MDAERGSRKMAGKFETPRGQAATDAKRKYIAAAKAAGMSLNEWIEKTLDAAAEG